MSLPHRQQALATALFDQGAYLDKDRSPEGLGFKLKLHEKTPDAPLSPFYLNLRTSDNPKPGPLTPTLVRQCAQEMFHLAQALNLGYDAVVGLPNAGDPFAEAFAKIALESGCPTKLFQMKKEGTKDKRAITELVSNNHAPGDHVLIIDDLCTKADTKLEGIEVLEKKGLEVVDVLVLLDRQQGGASELAARGYRLFAVFCLADLLQFYRSHQLIDEEEYTECLAYAKQV